MMILSSFSFEPNTFNMSFWDFLYDQLPKDRLKLMWRNHMMSHCFYDHFGWKSKSLREWHLVCLVGSCFRRYPSENRWTWTLVGYSSQLHRWSLSKCLVERSSYTCCSTWTVELQQPEQSSWSGQPRWDSQGKLHRTPIIRKMS